MSYRDYCSICHESYDDDNLASCIRCGRGYCYRCGGQQRGCCVHCSPEAQAPADEKPSAMRQTERAECDANAQRDANGSAAE